jgi:hypothetical protein
MSERTVIQKPAIAPSLLWEFDLGAFDFERSARVVIERVIERGNLNDWREIFRFYGEKQMLETARSSRQLCEKDKQFTEIFIHSTLLHRNEK